MKYSTAFKLGDAVRFRNNPHMAWIVIGINVSIRSARHLITYELIDRVNYPNGETYPCNPEEDALMGVESR